MPHDTRHNQTCLLEPWVEFEWDLLLRCFSAGPKWACASKGHWGLRREGGPRLDLTQAPYRKHTSTLMGVQDTHDPGSTSFNTWRGFALALDGSSFIQLLSPQCKCGGDRDLGSLRNSSKKQPVQVWHGHGYFFLDACDAQMAESMN